MASPANLIKEPFVFSAMLEVNPIPEQFNAYLDMA